MHILNVAVLLLCISCVAFGLICEVWKGHESVSAYVSVRGFQSLFGKAITQITANLVHTLLRNVFRDDSVFGHAVGSMLVVCGQKLKWLKLGFCNHYLASPWCHQMETFSALLVRWEGNPTITVEFSLKASDAGPWCFLWSAHDKRLSKQSKGWLFETPSLSL